MALIIDKETEVLHINFDKLVTFLKNMCNINTVNIYDQKSYIVIDIIHDNYHVFKKKYIVNIPYYEIRKKTEKLNNNNNIKKKYKSNEYIFNSEAESDKESHVSRIVKKDEPLKDENNNIDNIENKSINSNISGNILKNDKRYTSDMELKSNLEIDHIFENIEKALISKINTNLKYKNSQNRTDIKSDIISEIVINSDTNLYPKKETDKFLIESNIDQIFNNNNII